MQTRIFAYGTILEGASDPRVAAAIDRYAERVDEGRVPGWLYDLGPFPGAIPHSPEDTRQAWVAGVILTLLDPRRVFQVLDPYEDCDPDRPRAGMYRREWASATPLGEPAHPIRCQVYWLNKVPYYARRIEGGDWRAHIRARR